MNADEQTRSEWQRRMHHPVTMHVLGETVELVEGDRPFAWLQSDTVVDTEGWA